MPGDGSMHNMNTSLNPNRQPRGRQQRMHASAVAPTAFDNSNNLNNFYVNNNLAATFTEPSTLPSTVSNMQPFGPCVGQECSSCLLEGRSIGVMNHTWPATDQFRLKLTYN